MAESQATTQTGAFDETRRGNISDGSWVGGCDTLLFPTDLLQGCYSWSVNVLNRGGIIQTRPRRRRLFSIPGNRAQGFGEFLTLDRRGDLLFAVPIRHLSSHSGNRVRSRGADLFLPVRAGRKV